MLLPRLAGLGSLMFLAALAAAAPGAHADRPEPPSPLALQVRLQQIGGNPATLAAAIERGRNEGAVCRHCHGAGGNSVLPDVPNLAGQNAAYLLEQMNKFALGQRRSSDFMTGMIRALAPDERIDIALFMSRQPVTPKPRVVRADVEAGRERYAALCAGCHGADAIGTHVIPRLAGQHVEYLEASLKRYRDGVGRLDPYMAERTRRLEDDDIRRLAAFLSTL
jgi:cytochrome c553